MEIKALEKQVSEKKSIKWKGNKSEKALISVEDKINCFDIVSLAIVSLYSITRVFDPFVHFCHGLMAL